MTNWGIRLVIAFVLALNTAPHALAEPALRFVGANKETGISQAVVVEPTALAHTAQLLALDAAGRIVGKDNPAAQIERVLDHLETALAEAGSGLDRAVKVNVYVRRAELVSDVQKALAKRFAGEHKPAVTFVEGI